MLDVNTMKGSRVTANTAGDGIDGKHDVRDFHRHEGKEHRSEKQPPALSEPGIPAPHGLR